MSHIVLTTINPPTQAVRAFDAMPACKLIVVGDRKTPLDFTLENGEYLGPSEQEKSGFATAEHVPWNHYCRKNIGYLRAMQDHATAIAESDDDNMPENWFPFSDVLASTPIHVTGDRWINPYQWFTDELIWPRGYPLELIQRSYAARIDEFFGGGGENVYAPVRQYLAAGDPDVDAIYRLTVAKDDHSFEDNDIVLAPGTYTPFNSQSTAWDTEAFPLLYLPSFVSFRMTDIWRSFVAQACLHAAGWGVRYLGPRVRQVRNEHDLNRDFADEIPGYLRNAEIVDRLAGLSLSSKPSDIAANLRVCYEELVSMSVCEPRELPVLDAWLTDIAALGIA